MSACHDGWWLQCAVAGGGSLFVGIASEPGIIVRLSTSNGKLQRLGALTLSVDMPSTAVIDVAKGWDSHIY